MNSLIGAPNFQSSAATRKNLAPRPTREARVKVTRFMSATPDAMVNTL